MKLYLAGPLFTRAEVAFNLDLAGQLRKAGHEVWLPQEVEARNLTAAEIFRQDVEGIDWADVVVANMDGPDPDSGTCWECGYAYKKKPIIIFRTDFRAADELGKSSYNLMLTESADAQLNLPLVSTEDLANRICAALNQLSMS